MQSRAPAWTETSIVCSSPPATPPAVLIMTACSSDDGRPGQRTRNGPSSRRRARRVMPSTRLTASATFPCARLAAKICLSGAGARFICNSSNRHGALERLLIHGLAAAGVDDGAAVHDREMVAELAREVEVLLDQHHRDLPEI